MYQVYFESRHKLGLERLTGGNRGLVYANERQEEREFSDDTDNSITKLVWVYDVYEVDDARFSSMVKNGVVTEEHPFGDETKILRKTLARVLRNLGEYDSNENAEFKRYNEFVEALSISTIIGGSDANEPTDDEILAKAKAEKINAISEFDSSANVNVFSVAGQPMWLNHDQRSRLSASLSVCTEDTMTKYFGGVPYTFSVVMWRQMLNAVELYADMCQTITESHKATVLSMDSVADVESFDITIGYPEKLNFIV